MLGYLVKIIGEKFGWRLFMHNGAIFPAFDYRKLKSLWKSSGSNNIVLAGNRTWLLPNTINNVTVTSAGYKCGLVLRKCNTSDTTKVFLSTYGLQFRYCNLKRFCFWTALWRLLNPYRFPYDGISLWDFRHHITDQSINHSFRWMQ